MAWTVTMAKTFVGGDCGSVSTPNQLNSHGSDLNKNIIALVSHFRTSLENTDASYCERGKA